MYDKKMQIKVSETKNSTSFKGREILPRIFFEAQSMQ